jgi:hypothetical protein
MKGELGPKALHREAERVDGTYALRESAEAYRGHFAVENETLKLKNTLPWNTHRLSSASRVEDWRGVL